MDITQFKKRYPEKFLPLKGIFSHIHRGDSIFIHTGCGEPQYLVSSLINYVESNPKAIFDSEVLQVWTLDLAPYADAKFKKNFRHNSLFLGNTTRDAVNAGTADYTPVFLSNVPDLFYRRLIPLDVALIQTSLPDEHGYMSFGVSVDIVKAATEVAKIIIVQINSEMPRIHGDGFINIKDVNFAVFHDEQLLTFKAEADNDVAGKIGEYVSSLVQDGDTIQVGYGAIPNAVLKNLKGKKNLGVHTELLSDGLVELIREGVVDNSKKTINRGKTIASFCLGSKETYSFLNDDPVIEFRRIDYTNNSLIIARHENMIAINSALEIDLTGQATAETRGNAFYSSVGGQADFMRGAMLSKNGKTILAIQSTADSDKISRIVPLLKEGTGVTLHRGDIHYVVTEYGIAYLHGKNIRERAMALIAISHPKFRSHLIKEAKELNLIYKDQAFIPGKRGEYPEELETYRTTMEGEEILLRPVKISDEPLIKEFFYSLSDSSMHRRFLSERKDMPHERLQDFVVIDYLKEMIILAVIKDEKREEIVGLGQYAIDLPTRTAEVAFAVKDDFQNRGVGTELLSYLTLLARKEGLLGFNAEVLIGNTAMLHLFEKMGFDIEKRGEEGVFDLKMAFKGD
jgi:acyl-CoA hydrolase/GNAT superfamily N-acetyltransferase